MNNFSHVGTEQPLPGYMYYQYFGGVKCIVQGHNTAELDVETQTSRSEVRCSTTVSPLTPKLNSELLVPIDFGGFSPQTFPETYMCFIAEIRIHGNVVVFFQQGSTQPPVQSQKMDRGLIYEIKRFSHDAAHI